MVGASVTGILELVFPPCKLIAVTLCTNEECNKVSQIEEAMQTSLPTVCFLLRHTQDHNPIALQKWLEEWLTNQLHQYNEKITFKHNHPNCNSTSLTSLQSPFAPSVLFLETVELNTPLIPSFTLTIPVRYGLAIYRLSSIIYQGDFHFSARIIHNDSTFVTYTYDGRINDGCPTSEEPLQNLETDLLHLNGHRAHVFLYSFLSHHAT